MKTLRIVLWLVFCVLGFISGRLYAQDSLNTSGLFEGKVTYQYQITNPNPGLISDEEFYQSMPNEGKSQFVLYLKDNRYRYEYSDRIEIYNPSMNQVAVVALKNSDSISFYPVNSVDDSIKKISKLEITESVLGYTCNAIEVRSKWETRTFYFNANQLKSNSNLWRNHQRDFLSHYFSKSTNFPLLIRRKSMLGNYEIKALKVERIPVSSDLFKLP